ncbi:MAG: hypothetical protein AAF849_16320 [Bacteroidota bacterium]
MKKIFLSAIMTLIVLNFTTCKMKNKNLEKQHNICSSISIVEKYHKGINVDSNALENAILQIEEATGILSEFDGSPFAIKSPSKATLSKWREWLIKKEIICKNRSKQ